MDCGPPGSSVRGVYQVRVLEWVAMPFCRGSSQPRDGSWISCTAGGVFTTEPSGKALSVSSVQSLSCVGLFVTPWTTARQASLSITNSWSLLRNMPIESVMPSNLLILSRPLLLLPSVFPSIRSFQMRQSFASGGQSIGVSASTSVLPMNIQG